MADSAKIKGDTANGRLLFTSGTDLAWVSATNTDWVVGSASGDSTDTITLSYDSTDSYFAIAWGNTDQLFIDLNYTP